MSAPSVGAPSDMPRFTTGIRGLDVVLGGGFLLGGIYIIQGAPGAGKTILTNEMCFHHASQGKAAVFVTLLAENHARMLGNLRGLSFFDETRIGDQLTYLNGFNEMRDGGLDALTTLLRREVQRRRATLLVIDGLISAQQSAASDIAFKEFIRDLQEIALVTECTMFLTTNAAEAVSAEQTMVEGLVDLTDRVYGWQAASDLRVTKFRGSEFLRGRHSYKITSDGIAVYPRTEALYAYPSRTGVRASGRASTGIATLDNMMDGGLPAASTTMLMGPSGIGKTTMGLQFLSQSSMAEPGLMFGFYETPDRLRSKADRISPSLGALFDTGAVELVWESPTNDLLDAYGERLLEAVRRRGVKRLFIDGLTAFTSGAIDPSRIGNFFSALANELRVLGVTTVYSLEVPDMLGTAIRVPVEDASSLAENMIFLRFVEKGASLYRLISVLKVRDSDFDSSLHEFHVLKTGIDVDETAESAEKIMARFPEKRSAKLDSTRGGAVGRPTKRGG